MAVENLSAQHVRDLFSYDPETGSFQRRSRASGVQFGREAGCFTYEGYRQVVIDKKPYFGHRLIWLHFYGEWPKGVIDHINGRKDDNRIVNLRDVTNSTNRQNVKAAYRSNKSTGVLGVYYEPSRRKFRASITVNGKVVRLGRFDTIQAAEGAYLEAKRALHVGCTI